VKSLADIAPSQAYDAQQAALMRLQLYAIGKTHSLLSNLAGRMRAILLDHANDDGTLDGLGFYQAQAEIGKAWSEHVDAWKELFSVLRYAAAALPFGTLAVLHQAYISTAPVDERRRLTEATAIVPTQPLDINPVFDSQLKAILDAADRRIYQDGLQLSQRIWKLDNNTLDELKKILAAGMANGDSAWKMDGALEDYLGAGTQCPRWTSQRLYQLRKVDIASGDRRGLLSGDACDASGVAYNALRLARNEIQIVHHMATDALLAASPWVEKEKIVLSPAHPEHDICDETVADGEDGEGIYPVGTIILPLHVQCLCFKTAVLMDPAAFTSQLRGWMQGASSWPAMDSYAQMLGTLPGGITSIDLSVKIARSLAVWLWGDAEALDDALTGWGPVQFGLF
jgi:hypothetical protein